MPTDVVDEFVVRKTDGTRENVTILDIDYGEGMFVYRLVVGHAPSVTMNYSALDENAKSEFDAKVATYMKDSKLERI